VSPRSGGYTLGIWKGAGGNVGRERGWQEGMKRNRNKMVTNKIK
jgi:hypothetical protein